MRPNAVLKVRRERGYEAWRMFFQVTPMSADSPVFRARASKSQ
jgi:hypothetical protein